MEKTFEDYLSELQADMVAICLEYVEHQAEEVYIYGSYEENAYAFNVFYKIKGKILLPNEVKNVLEKPEELHDPSSRRHWNMFKAGTGCLKEIHKKCNEFNRDMFTEIKLVYNVKENKLKANYRYDPVVTNTEDLLPMDIFLAWYEEVKKANEG